MKRDPKLNPFDPRNPEYWFRERLIGVVKVDYSNGYKSTPATFSSSLQIKANSSSAGRGSNLVS